MHPFYLPRLFLFFVGLLVLADCQEADKHLFTQLDPSQTQVTFVNRVEETEELNIMTYEYLYNGGGVAAGDLNNDGLQDLFFTGNSVPNRLYLNRGKGGAAPLAFEDITQTAGVGGRARWKTGVTFADVNADGLLDIYLCYSGPGSDADRTNELYLNNGGAIPTFTERARDFGLDAPGTYSTQASFFDYDRDGDLDMFLLNHAKVYYSPFYNTKKLRAKRHPQFGNRLYRNDGGRFTDVSEAAGIFGSAINFGLGISVSDVNNDGWPDVYVTNDYEEQDFFYLNNGDGTFRECLKQVFRHISRFGMGSDIADYNNDGLTDVLVVDMLPEDNRRQKLLKGPDEYDKYHLLNDSGYHHQNMRNTLQLNTGPGPDGLPVFSEIGQLAGVSNTDWSWCPLFADFDNDGRKDLFITNGYLRDYTNLDFLKYTVADARKAAQEAGVAMPVYQVVQQMPSTKISNYAFRNQGGLSFQNETSSWGLSEAGISSGATYADLDNDGDLDLVINHLNQTAAIFRNNAESLAPAHYLKIRLQGEGGNRFGIGAKVTVGLEKGPTLMQEVFPTRGFQSCVPAELNFGLGTHTQAKSVRVQWPDGRVTELTSLPADTLLVIQPKGGEPVAARPDSITPLFREYTQASGVDFVHTESHFVDFKVEYLLPYQLSRLGPGLAKGDVNGDGNEDFYVGGAYKQAGQLYLMTQEGAFKPAASQPWRADSLSEDTGALFFDADQDGDLDLYVVSGGTEYPPEFFHLLQDRLYLNNGKGDFTKAARALPRETSSGSCVVAADFDHDGDLDLFVGGRVVPGRYPTPPVSHLLRNDSRPGNVTFTVVTPPSLESPGMVTTAAWLDYNGDSWPDLVIAGELMPIVLFENQHGQLVRKTGATGLEETEGLWCQMAVADFDDDGDPDLVLGNAGTNTQLKASHAQPLTLHYGDFNKDGRIDPILSYYVQGKPYPYPSRDEMLDQLPALKQKFVRYSAYADASLEDVLTPEQLAEARVLKAAELRSCYLENTGDGTFRRVPLPEEAQFSMLFGLLAGDYDGDGKKDLLLSGNFYSYRVQLGRNDAGSGLLLKGDGKGHFQPLMHGKTGFFAPGDIRNMVEVKNRNGESRIVIGKNNEPVQVVKWQGRSPGAETGSASSPGLVRRVGWSADKSND